MGRFGSGCSLAIAAWLAALGCSDDRFLCSSDASCTGPTGGAGWCEETGFCSFPADDCPSGRRYGNAAADPLAGRCVPLPDQAGTAADDGLASESRSDGEMETSGGAGDEATSGAEQGDSDVAGETSDDGIDPETSAADDGTTTGMNAETTSGGSGVEVCNGIDDDEDGLIDEISARNDECGTCRMYQREDRTYQFCEEPFAWLDAQQDCRSRGFDLVALESDAENDEVTDFAQPASFGDFWIGASDVEDEGQFVWPDGTPLDADDYARFRDGEPNNSGGNEHCAEMEGSNAHEWDDKNCTVTQGYICEAAH